MNLLCLGLGARNVQISFHDNRCRDGAHDSARSARLVDDMRRMK